MVLATGLNSALTTQFHAAKLKTITPVPERSAKLGNCYVFSNSLYRTGWLGKQPAQNGLCSKKSLIARKCDEPGTKGAKEPKSVSIGFVTLRGMEAYNERYETGYSFQSFMVCVRNRKRTCISTRFP